jgi:Flp pilus assembly protein CpaB
MEQRTMIIVTVVLAVVVAFLTLAIVAGIYLTGGETYEVPVAAGNLPENVQIKKSHLTTEERDEEPSDNVITDPSKLVGRVTQKSISSGEPFRQEAVQDVFTVVRARDSIPAGNRIQADMVEEVTTENRSSGAFGRVQELTGKMVRQGIPANAIINKQDVYQNEEEIVVATDSIEPNSILREDDVQVVSRPDVPPDAVSDPGNVVGRAVKSTLKSGQVVRETDLFAKREQLSYFVPLYRRGVTIPVSNYNNVSYQLRPGDRVDLYVYLPQGFRRGGTSQNPDQLTTDMLQKVADGAEIIALNDVYTQEEIDNIESGGGDENQSQNFTYQEMTLGVTLWEAEKIHLVRGQQEAGNQNLRFFVLVRPRQLESEYGSRSVSNYDLFNKELGNRSARESSGPRVEVIQGNRKEAYRVPEYR